MHKAVKLLQKIPKGKVITYKELAKATKTHPRAVGQLMKNNQHTVLFPCYKVILSSGKVGGYSAKDGRKRKIKLLEKDGINVKNGWVNLKECMFRMPAGQSRRR